ncbi:hypothetical protein ED208_03765 [Stagnimonas aquatica]|uniref:Spore coat protein U/FanG domain-containing protein n=1 Tax=Stagnimonas aquatica TaxID=2689987 RepID=A0A3N0VLM3_9GAMM|nr:spore coat protein U domain-containing protein [Stagnimonas aquatica]ROH93649.1 hypothetical protein ED208_03765 [Stagnimonas aquatica]
MLLRPVLAAGFSLTLASAALAETKATTVPVSARFIESCTAGTQPIEFGELPRMTTGKTVIVSRKLVVDCSSQVNYRVGLDAGLNFSAASPNRRRLAGPNGAFSLYTVLLPNAGGDPGAIWGDAGLGGTLLASPFSGTGNGVSSEFPYTAVAFGVVPGVGDPSGNYSDTLTMTISY